MDQIPLISQLVLIIFLIHTVFLFRYFIPFVFKKDKHLHNTEVTEKVSVVICAHNELENLQRNLPLFLNQHSVQFEVIVVDDRSKDGSEDWLGDKLNQYPHLKVVQIKQTPDHYNSKKYAISKGIEAAANEIILLSDADCRPSSTNWVARMSQSFNCSTMIVLGVSLYEKKKGFLNQFIRYETLQTALIYLSFANQREAYMGVGRNLAYRKSYFLECGGFNDLRSIMGGDDDLWVNKHSKAGNTEICTHHEGMTFSDAKDNWTDFFIQKRRHLSVGKYYKTIDKIKLGIFHLSQSSMWILFILAWVLGSPTDCLILSFLFLMYIIGQYVVFFKLSIKFGIKFAHYNLPLLEILFVGYFWIWGIYASLSKHLKWK